MSTENESNIRTRGQWNVYANNNDDDDGQWTNFDQKSSLEPSAQVS